MEFAVWTPKNHCFHRMHCEKFIWPILHTIFIEWCPKFSNTISNQTEHFRTLLTWNKCIAVCWAKHNELFKLAQHPNADNIGIIPCIHHTHTNTRMKFGELFCIFCFAFICVLSGRTTRMTARWIFICMSQFVCSFNSNAPYVAMPTDGFCIETYFFFYFKRILHTKYSQTRAKKEASHNDSTTYVMRCSKKNVFVYGRFRKSPLPIPRRSSIGSSFPFSCIWMPRSNWLQRKRRRQRRRRRHRHAHFGTWKAWESNNWIGHLDIIFKTKIMTTQQCYPGLCKQNAPLFNK